MAEHASQAGSTSTQLVQLVYAQEAPDGSEPLVAVVSTESEASQIELETKARHPGVRVRWETHRVIDGPSDTVYVLLLDAGGPRDGEPTDPMGIAVYGHEHGAAERLRTQEASQPGHVVARYAVGWRRPGWPFSA